MYLQVTYFLLLKVLHLLLSFVIQLQLKALYSLLFFVPQHQLRVLPKLTFTIQLRHQVLHWLMVQHRLVVPLQLITFVPQLRLIFLHCKLVWPQLLVLSRSFVPQLLQLIKLQKLMVKPLHFKVSLLCHGRLLLFW